MSLVRKPSFTFVKNLIEVEHEKFNFCRLPLRVFKAVLHRAICNVDFLCNLFREKSNTFASF